MSLVSQEFRYVEALRLFIVLSLQFISSYIVKKGRLKVNYSRKVSHFGHLFTSILMNGIFLNYSIDYFIISGIMSTLQILFFAEPIRKRVYILEFLFLGIDRPEDRPHTVRLALTQIVAMNFVLIGMAYLYQGSRVPLDLLAIPLLITAIGDELAEPVGIRFGRNKYQVTALFTDERYTRSIEGSMMVTLTSIATCYFMRYLFTSGQFIFLIVTMPILMTLTEAYSPHTWDNPFLYLVGSTCIWLVISFL